MCSAKRHVRFTPNSDRESGHRQTVRSALPPKADMCGATWHVCFGPKADIGALAGQYHPAFHPGLEATSLATACANRRAHERAAEACRYPAADVVGYSRLTGLDEEGTLKRLRKLRRELINPAVALHRGRIVKTTGDGILIEFPSVVDAVRCALDVQRGTDGRNMDASAEQRIEFRIGINLGDVVIEGDDLLGDGVNVAARLEGISEPGGICISEAAYQQVRDKLDVSFEDAGEQQLKNIVRPVRTYRLRLHRSPAPAKPASPLPDKPSIAVLPFQNMSGDPEQEYFADGVVEEIITALSRFRQLFVIARNSSFTYRGRAVDVKQVGQELGVRYVLEGSIRKAGNRVRITGQLIDTATDYISGRIAWRVALKTSSVYRTKSPRAWSAQSRRSLNRLRSSVPSASRPKASTPTTTTCAVCPAFINLLVVRPTPKRCAYSTARSISIATLLRRTAVPPIARPGARQVAG